MDEFAENCSAPIHHSLVRPQLLMGCDRELYLSIVLCSVILIFPAGFLSGNFFAVVVGALIWVIGLVGLAAMAKADPYMRHVFVRSLTYRSYYLATDRASDPAPPQWKRW